MNAKRGSILIYLSLLVALVIGLWTSSINARLLSPIDLGGYRFLQSSLSVVTVISTFGLLNTYGVLAVSSREGQSEDLLWTGVLLHSAVIGFVSCVATFGVLITQTDWFSGREVFTSLSVALSFFSFVPVLFLERFRASGDYIGLFILNALPPVVYCVFVGACLALHFKYDGPICSFLYFLSQALAFLVIALRGRLAFRVSVLGWRRLCTENRNIGVNVYFATMLAAFSAQAGVFALQYSSGGGLSSVAEFSLALTISAPLTMLPGAIGTAYFSRLKASNGFPPNVLAVTWLVMLVVLGVFFGVVGPAVDYLFGDRYVAVKNLAMWCSVGAVLHGMGDVYNRYYLVNRATQLLLNVVVAVTVTSLVSSVLLAKLIGTAGAAMAKLLAGAVYVAVFVYFYHFRRKRY